MDFEQINILFSNGIEYSKYMINIVLSWKNWSFSLSHFQPNWLSKSTYLKFVFSHSAIILFIFFIFVLFLLFLFHFTSTLHFHFLIFFFLLLHLQSWILFFFLYMCSVKYARIRVFYDSVLIQKYTGQMIPVFWYILFNDL